MLLIFRKNHEATFFLLALLSDQKRGKSHLRGFSILLKITFRVHELVAGSSAWQVRAANSKVKSNSLALPTASSIPRVRTYHTKKPSRFVHALSARLHNRCGGRESNMCADGMESTLFIFSIDYTWVLSCRGRRRRRPAT